MLFPACAVLAGPREVKRMKEESFLRVGRKGYKMTGHFPPTPADPYLRLIYPREIGPNDKSLVFELYLPVALATVSPCRTKTKSMGLAGAMRRLSRTGRPSTTQCIFSGHAPIVARAPRPPESVVE